MTSSSESPEQFSKDDFIRNACRKYLIPFSVAMNKNYETAWHLEAIARRLERAVTDLENGHSTRLVLEMPPRYGKSELTTINFPAWVLGKHPEWPVIVCAHTAELASEFGRKTRDIIQEDNYKKVFKTRLRQDSNAKDRWNTKENGGYTTAGVTGPITGKGFKIGIIDDPHKSRAEADSQIYRESIWNWWKGTFYTRQEGASIIIVIMTRWHLDDLVGRIEQAETDAELNKEAHDEWEYLSFPAIAEDDEDKRKQGEALWPWKFPLNELEKIKTTIGVTEWSAQYQQSPIISENAEFRKEWFRYYEEQEMSKEWSKMRFTTTVDLAVSKKDSADNVVILTCAKYPDSPNIYRVEETAGKLDPLKTIDAIFKHQSKYRSEVYIEEVGYQKALRYFVEEEQKKRQQFFVVNTLSRNNVNSKESRIRGLIPLYGAGVIFHRRGEVEYEKELLQFPVGKHDDRIDTMASQLEAVEGTKKVIPKRPRPQWKPFSTLAGI